MCDRTEAARRLFQGCGLAGLSVLAGVDVIGDQLAGFVAPRPGILQGDVRVDAEGQTFLLAAKAVLEPPPLSSFGRDLEIEAALVGVAPRFFVGLEGAALLCQSGALGATVSRVGAVAPRCIPCCPKIL
jgi:hypothetical protein